MKIEVKKIDGGYSISTKGRTVYYIGWNLELAIENFIDTND